MIRQKIMLVYYGADFLPYKDKARTTHYPMVGNVITGENNVRVIYFDTSAIGGAGDITWIANVEKPDGGRFYRILQETTNEDGETFMALELSDLYTDIVGNIKVGLSGYFGQFALNENPETEEIEISGQPQIIATGCIQIGINYTPVVLPMGGRLSHSVEQQILGLLAQAVISKETFVILDNIATATLTSYDSTQLFFDRTTNNFYKKTENPLVPYQKVTLGDLATHIADHTNPHQVTKAQVGLSNVDNTSDLNKPLSTAMVEALAEKLSADSVVNTKSTSAGKTYDVRYVNALEDELKTQLEYIGLMISTATTEQELVVELDAFVLAVKSRYKREGDIVNISGGKYDGQQWEYNGENWGKWAEGVKDVFLVDVGSQTMQTSTQPYVTVPKLTSEQLVAIADNMSKGKIAIIKTNIDTFTVLSVDYLNGEETITIDYLGLHLIYENGGSVVASYDEYASANRKIAGHDLRSDITTLQLKADLLPTTTSHSGTTFSGSLASYDTHLFTDNLTSLTITALSVASGDEEPMWLIDFKTGATFTFTATPTIVWNGGTPSFSANKHYTLVIRKSGSEYLGTWLEF